MGVTDIVVVEMGRWEWVFRKISFDALSNSVMMN